MVYGTWCTGTWCTVHGVQAHGARYMVYGTWCPGTWCTVHVVLSCCLCCSRPSSLTCPHPIPLCIAPARLACSPGVLTCPAAVSCTAAHGCFSSVTVTGPIATTAADLMLVYAALANVDYPHSPSRPARTLTSSSSGRKPNKGADAAVAAAAAFEAPPLQPLELPRVLLPGLQQAGRRAASWKPLAGLSVGIYREWYTMCDTGVLACVDSAAESLLKLGATLVDIQIPELDLLQARAVRLLPLNFLAWRVRAAFDLGMACMRPCVWPRKSMHMNNQMFCVYNRTRLLFMRLSAPFACTSGGPVHGCCGRCAARHRA
jgi:hypothetical protein